MKSARAAFTLLTRLPLQSQGAPGSSASGWFPLVGLALGASAAVPMWLLTRYASVGGRALVLGVLVVAWWAWATRMLHWDGLADTADGLWGATEPVKRLAIMADSRTGAFGVTAIALVALAEVVGIATAIGAGRVWPLVLAPVLGRTSAALLVWGRRPVRAGGLGAAVAGRPGWGAVAVAALTVAASVALVTLEDPSIVASAAFPALALTIVIPFALSRPLDGYTGDVLGATILIVEAAVLVLGGLL